MDGLDWQQVTTALNTAAAGLGLKVKAIPEMRGAVITGDQAEAYLVPVGAGVNVECWRRSDSDPYKIIAAGGLDDEVQMALAEVLAA